MSNKNPIAENIWWMFAHLQWAVDEILWSLFSKLSDSKKKSVSESSSRFKKAIYKTWWFFGDIGKSYYEKYEDIKAKKSEK